MFRVQNERHGLEYGYFVTVWSAQSLNIMKHIMFQERVTNIAILETGMSNATKVLFICVWTCL
jgi:hypothetical protein